MFTKVLATVFFFVSVAVLPTPSRPRTKRKSRGPEIWTDFRTLALSDAVVSEAESVAKDLHRIAVVPVTSRESDEISPAEVSAELIRGGLRYSDSLILMDLETTSRIFQNSDQSSVVKIANQSNIDHVVLVSVPADEQRIQLTLMGIESQKNHSFSIPWKGAGESIIDASCRARRQILTQLNAVPSQFADQLDRAPDASAESLTELLAARQILSSAILTEDHDERKKLCRDAVGRLDHAIELSPNLLEAYSIKTSCHLELGQVDVAKSTLEKVKPLCDSRTSDKLLLLELNGDYAGLVKGGVEGQTERMENYYEIISISPTDLRGLWTMLDVALPDQGEEYDLEMAAKFASKLITFHPHSSVAQAIREAMGK